MTCGHNAQPFPAVSLLTWSKQKAMLCYTGNHCFNELSQEWLKSRDTEILITSVLWLNVNLILHINMVTDTKSRITFRSDALVLAILYFTVTQSKLLWVPPLYLFHPCGYIQYCFSLSKPSFLSPVGRSGELGSTITFFQGTQIAWLTHNMYHKQVFAISTFALINCLGLKKYFV